MNLEASIAQARALGRAEGQSLLECIRAGAGLPRQGLAEVVPFSFGVPRSAFSILSSRRSAPVARCCHQCARTSPFGTLAYESIAQTGRCPTCINRTEPSAVRDLPPAA